RELRALVSRASESAGVVRRAHVVLWSADGVSGQEIAQRLHLTPEAVSRIRKRFLESGAAGLQTQAKSGRTVTSHGHGPGILTSVPHGAAAVRFIARSRGSWSMRPPLSPGER